MADNDFEEINRLALQQVNMLESQGPVSTPVPYKSPRSSFWDDDDKLTSKYRPSGNVSTVPLAGAYGGYGSYTGTSSYIGSKVENGVTDTDRFFRRTLNAVYRTETKVEEKTSQEGKPVVQPQQLSVPVEGGKYVEQHQVFEAPVGEVFFGSRLLDTPAAVSAEGSMFGGQSMLPTMPRLQVSQNTKDQLTAIVLSGFARMASTAVLNWAKERKVPYELL